MNPTAVVIRTAFAFTVHERWSKPNRCLLLVLFILSSFLTLPQCTQSTKGMLGRVVRSLDFHELCPPGTPKTAPMGLEGSRSVVLSAEPSASVSCAPQPTLQSVVTPCPHFSRINKRDSLHSTNPAFRLASPSPSLNRAGFVLEVAPEVSFVPLPWERPKAEAGVAHVLNAPRQHQTAVVSQRSGRDLSWQFAGVFCEFISCSCLSIWRVILVKFGSTK